MKPRLVIVGNGMAGLRLAEELDALGAPYSVTIFGAEGRPAYNRIRLAEALSGAEGDALTLRPAEWYLERGIELRADEAVLALEPDSKRVRTAKGERPYDVLALAMGSEALIPPIAGTHLDRVLRFRTLADVEALRRRIRPGEDALVVGGGLLGLEAADGLARAGMRVTVVHLMPHLLERQLDAAAEWAFKREEAGPEGPASSFPGLGSRQRLSRNTRVSTGELWAASRSARTWTK